MSTEFTIKKLTTKNLVKYIKNEKDGDYAYCICVAVLHKAKQPVTYTEFDNIDLANLNYPNSNEEDLFFPQLIIGYKNSQLVATLEQGYFDEHDLVQSEEIKSIEITVDDAAKLIMAMSTVYNIINVFGVPIVKK
jgi:hypothetical protein